MPPKRLNQDVGGEGGAIVEVKRQKVENAIVSANGKAQSLPNRTSSLSAPTMLLTGHADHVLTMQFNATGDIISSGSQDKSIFLWKTYGECHNFLVLRGHKNAVLHVQWINADTLVSCSADKTLRLWDALTGEEIARQTESKAIINSISCCNSHYSNSNSPTLIVSGGDDGVARLWDGRAGRTSVKKLASSDTVRRYPLTAVAFNDSGDQVFTGGVENMVHVWDLRRDGDVCMTLHGHSDTITGMALSPSGTHLLTNSMDNTLRSWDIRPYAPENRCVQVFTGHTHGVEKNLLRCDWSSDGSLVTAGSADRMVYIWDNSTGEMKYALPGHKGCVNEVVFHPREPIVGSASSDKTIYLGELA